MTRLSFLAVLVLAPLAMASAQHGPVPASGTDSMHATRTSTPLVRPVRAGITSGNQHAEFATSASQDSTVTVRRGRYAWWGLAIGAGAGWLVAREACRRDECYVTSTALILLGGSALGLLVGLVIG